jgi:hypothetical protein
MITGLTDHLEADLWLTADKGRIQTFLSTQKSGTEGKQNEKRNSNLHGTATLL